MRILKVHSKMIAGMITVWFLTGCGLIGTDTPADPYPIPSIDESAVLPQVAELCGNAFELPVNGGSPVGSPLYLMNRTYQFDAAWDIVDYPHQAYQDQDLAFLVCIQETRTEVGKYSSKSTAYRKEWTVRVVDWNAGTVFAEGIFQGDEPAQTIAISEGEEELEAYYGDPPYAECMTWLTTNPQGALEFLYFAQESTDLEVSSTGDLAAYGGEEHLFLADLDTLVVEADLVQDEWISSIELSPDGGTLIFSTATQLSVLDVATRQILTLPEREVSHITLSPDGKWLATITQGKLVKMWEMQTVEMIGSFIPHMGMDALAIRFSPDGRTVATIGEDNFMRLWDVATGQQRFEVDLEKQPRLLAFSPDGTTLAAKADGKPLIFLDTKTLKEINRIDPGFWVLWLAFSPDGDLVVLSGEKNSRSVWNTRTGEEIVRLSGFAEQGGRAGRMVFSPDGLLLAGISGHVVRLWDTASWEERTPFAGHTRDVETISFTPDAQQLITSSRDNTIRVWNLMNAQYGRSVAFHALTPQNMMLASLKGSKKGFP